MNKRLLSSYLNDHLTGAYGGLALARRIAASHEDADETGLRRLAGDVAEDVDALVAIMQELGIRPARERQPLVRWGEVAGRLKPNGSWTRRTALTDLVELELMALAVAGKAAGWRSLLVLATVDDRLSADRVADLLGRAAAQEELLEGLRVAAVGPALVGGPAAAAP